MSGAETENISKYLRTKDIQLPSNNKWLVDCINWYKSHLELKNIYQSLQDYVCIQWLLSDLHDVQQRSLPNDCKNGVVELSGKYCVQVNWVRDISQPCYTQLQAIKNSNIADSNDNVTAEETKKQSWEPSPKRVLMMEVTDGFTTLKAIEHSPIPKLTEPFIPGFKVVLIGPIECRKGILFLKNHNVNLLGGEVDFMGDMYSKEAILSRCLNIMPPESNNSNSGPGRNVNANSPTPPSLEERRPPLFNDVDQLPDSTSFLENNPYEDNGDAMMADDDDELLCQLPDTMFNDVDNVAPQPNNAQLSPVLDEGPPEVQSSTFENIPKETSYNKTKNIHRPKLFPSMEDLRTDKKSSPIKRQPITNSSCEKSRENQYGGDQSISRTSSGNINSLKSTTAVSKTEELCGKQPLLTINITSDCGSFAQQKMDEHELNLQNLNDSISNNIDSMLDEVGEENIYPQFKRVNVKVLSITKLKIRNGEWNCCATVSIENKTENVTFCNKLLERLFGTSAAEVEILRSEMAKNQSLKEKINDTVKSTIARDSDCKRPRPIIVRFVGYRHRQRIFAAKKKLKGSGVTVREDLTARRMEVYRAAAEKHGVKNTWTLDGRVLWLDSQGRKGVATRMSDVW